MVVFILLLVFIAIAVGLAWFLISRDRGQKEPVSALWLAVGLGFAGAIAASVIEVMLIPDENLQPGAGWSVMLLAALGVGVIEEACKFLPLAIYIFRQPYFNERTDGVIYFALAGLGFGLPENLLYTLQYGSQTGVGRLLLTPLFHAATTGMIGYYLAGRKLGNRPLFSIWPVLLAAMVLHGLYDFGLSSGVTAYTAGSLVITFGLSAAFFVLFLHAVEHDQDRGLSVVGNNNFCRSCGLPNPQRHLYCVHCGKNA